MKRFNEYIKEDLDLPHEAGDILQELSDFGINLSVEESYNKGTLQNGENTISYIFTFDISRYKLDEPDYMSEFYTIISHISKSVKLEINNKVMFNKIFYTIFCNTNKKAKTIDIIYKDINEFLKEIELLKDFTITKENDTIEISINDKSYNVVSYQLSRRLKTRISDILNYNNLNIVLSKDDNNQLIYIREKI